MVLPDWLNGVLVWGGWGFVAILASFALPALVQPFLPDKNDYVAQLGDPVDRARLKAELSGQRSALDLYLDGVSGLRARLEQAFGPPWSWRAFDRCLLVAFVYPIFLLVMGWALGAPGTIGTLRLLPEQAPAQRALSALVLVSISLALFFWFKLDIPERFGRYVRDLIVARQTKGQRDDLWFANVAGFVAFAVAIAGAVAIAIAGAVAFAFAFAGAGAVAFAFAFAGAGAVAFAFAFAGAGAVAFAFAFAGAGTGAFAVAYFVFLCALPVANAVLDWLSWWATRALLHGVNRGRRGPLGLLMAAGAVLLDLLVAVICLVALCAVAAIILELANAVFVSRGWPIFDWRQQMEQAIRAPFTEGFLVTGMLVTTLVPTLLHVGVGLGHLFASALPDCRACAALITDTMPTSDKQKVARVLVYRKLCWIPGLVLTLVGAAYVIALFTTVLGPVGQSLGFVAECAASLVNGECRLPATSPAPPRPTPLQRA